METMSIQLKSTFAYFQYCFYRFIRNIFNLSENIVSSNDMESV